MPCIGICSMDAEPHVLHLHSSAGVYGAEYVMLGLVPALARLGIGSTLLCLDNYLLHEQPLYERAVAMGVPAQRLVCTGRFDRNTVRALRIALAARPGALLHVHDYKSAFYAWLARRRGVPPIVATLHGHIGNTRSLRLYNCLELWLMRRFNHVCIVSDEMRPSLAAADISSQRISLIENGIDTARFRPDVEPMSRAEYGIPADAYLFGGAMRLSGEKNPLGLIEAFARVAKEDPRAWLAIAGDGPQREAITLRADDLGITGRICLLGARDDLERYYPMLDCFILPSLQEGLPLSLLEAMAAERRLVSTAVGQIPAVVANLPVRLVPPANVPALASAMQAVLGERGPVPELRQRVVEHYSVSRMARDYAAVYRDLWKNHGRTIA